MCHSLDPILEDAPSPTSYYSPFPDHISHPPLEDSSSPMSRCPSLSDHNHDPTINSLSPNSYRPPHSDYDPLDHSPSSYSPLSTFSFLSNVLSPFTDSDEGKSLRFFFFALSLIRILVTEIQHTFRTVHSSFPSCASNDFPVTNITNVHGIIFILINHMFFPFFCFRSTITLAK